MKKFRTGCVIALAGLVAVGCTPAVQVTTSIDETSASDTAQAQQLPDYYLSAKVLYDLLISELTYYRDDKLTSVEVMEPLALETRDPRILSLVTRRAIDISRYDIAAKTAQLWVEIEPQSEQAWLANATIHLETREYDKVVDEFVNFIEFSERETDFNMNEIAYTLNVRADPEKAYQLYEQVLSNYPESVVGHLELITLAIRSGADSAQVDALFDRTFEISPESDFAATYRFSVLLDRSQTAEASKFAESHLKKYADSRSLRGSYAGYLAQEGLYQQAVKQFELLDTDEALYRAGLLHRQANRRQLAHAAFAEYFERVPNDQNVYVQLADLALEEKQFDVALEWLQRISSDRLQFQKHLLTSTYLASTETVDKGINYLLNYAVQSNDQWIRIYLLMDEIYREFDQLIDAKLVLDEALEKFPENYTLLLARSFTLAELHMIKEFEIDIQILLDRDPNNTTALNALGYTLADQTDRLEEALDLIQRAHDLRPNDPYILDSLGWVHYKLGNLEPAIEYLELALDRRRGPIMAAHLGEVYWHLGKRSRAKMIWNEVLKENPDNKFLIETINRFTEQ